jgi:hypothetical protein
MPDSGTDQYSIEIKNLRTGETVILTSVDMTEQEKSVVVRQLLRLSGGAARGSNGHYRGVNLRLFEVRRTLLRMPTILR